MAAVLRSFLLKSKTPYYRYVKDLPVEPGFFVFCNWQENLIHVRQVGASIVLLL